MLTAPRIVPRPETTRPITHMSPPTPGEKVSRESGVYAVHPKSAPPPGSSSDPITIKPPNRNSQYEKAFSRGNATSGDPICNGSTRLAKANTTGVA